MVGDLANFVGVDVVPYAFGPHFATPDIPLSYLVGVAALIEGDLNTVPVGDGQCT